MAGEQCTGLQVRPPTFLDITSGAVEELQRLVPSLRPRCKRRWHSAAPSIISGCTSHAGNR